MKVFRNKRSGSILFVDGNKRRLSYVVNRQGWKSETFDSWYPFREGSLVDLITKDKQENWEKIGVKTYYEKILL